MSNEQTAATREAESIAAELSPGFAIAAPLKQRAPVVFCSPHSGRIYPKTFLESSRLNAHDLRKSEDCYVDELFASVVGLGAPLIAAHFPRAYLDLNREPYELDPELFHGQLPSFANTQSVRVAGGLGTIARIVSEAEEIYSGPVPLAAALERINRLYFPFHEALDRLIGKTRQQFGLAILIDCHSMPSTNIGSSPSQRPDFVIGDRFGDTCDCDLTHFIRDALTALGYQVQLNRPYAGGHITEHYGEPARGVHALQIEINRALYMNERTLKRRSGFKSLQKDLAGVASGLFDELPQLLLPRAAAE